MSRTAYLLLFLIGWTLSACNPPDTNRIRISDLSAWEQDEPVTLEYRHADSTRNVDISLMVRKNKNYPYDALRLEITAVSPDGLFWRDTVTARFPVLSPDSVSATASLIDYEFLFRENANLSEGVYRFSIRHLMEERPVLKNIRGIGLKFE